MPIYEYECADCQDVIEACQRISDAPLTICKQCGGPLHKLISKSSFHLKGGGWYADGYGSTSTADKTPKTSKTNNGKTSSPPCPKESKGSSCCAEGKPCKCAA